MAEHDHHHDPGHVHLGEADWEELAGHAEREGELLVGFVSDAARAIADRRDPGAPPVRRVLDVGSGPGVGTCELARCFPDARVVAVDSSPAMLERAARRAVTQGLAARVGTHLAELPHGVAALAPADVIWASMSLHHVGDETAALRVLRELLVPSGLLGVAEVADPMRVLPADLDVGPPGLVERLELAERDWFAAMRAGLPASTPSADLTAMLTAAGFDVVDARVVHARHDPPLTDAARQFVLGRIRHARSRLDGRLDAEDLAALDVLADADDPRGAAHRPDVLIAASRLIVIARPRR